MKKRILSLLLAALAALALCAPALASGEPAADAPDLTARTGSCGKGVSYSISDDGTLTISGQGRIDENVFFSGSITKLVIEPGVTYLASAFERCSRLTSIFIDSDLDDIPAPSLPNDNPSLPFEGVGQRSASLTVTFGSHVTHVPSYLFYSPDAGEFSETRAMVTEVVLGPNVRSVGENAFCNCTAIRNVTVQNPSCQLYTYQGGSLEPNTFFGDEAKAVIHGWPGSTAETYAKFMGYAFRPLETGPQPTAAPQKDGLVTGGDGRQYLYSGGVMLHGLHTVGGADYYFSVQDGHLMKGGIVRAGGGLRYFLGSDGRVARGLVTDGGKQYYASAKDGHLMSGGWARIGGGRQVQLDGSGVVIAKKGF